MMPQHQAVNGSDHQLAEVSMPAAVPTAEQSRIATLQTLFKGNENNGAFWVPTRYGQFLLEQNTAENRSTLPDSAAFSIRLFSDLHDNEIAAIHLDPQGRAVVPSYSNVTEPSRAFGLKIPFRSNDVGVDKLLEALFSSATLQMAALESGVTPVMEENS